jgi:hypothetical protein
VAAGDFTTLAAVKDWLGLTSSAEDALLARLITNTSADIVNYLGRSVLTASFAEKRDGTGGDRIMAAGYPIAAVQSVYVNGVLLPQSIDGVRAVGWGFDSRGFTYVGGRWPMGRRNVWLNYTAGFATPPSDIDQACLDWVSFRYREKDRIGNASKSVAGETVSFITTPMPSTVKSSLASYCKVVPT